MKANNHMKEVEFLRKRLQQEIDSFRKRRTSNRAKAFLVKIITVALGALATVALGVKSYLPPKYEPWLSALALCVTAVIPIVATWEAFFDHRWLWIQYTATLGMLYSLSDELEYAMATGSQLSQQKLDDLYARLQTALVSTNTSWAEKRSKDQAAEEPKDKTALPQSE
jgi:uncharacterized membrane protein